MKIKRYHAHQLGLKIVPAWFRAVSSSSDSGTVIIRDDSQLAFSERVYLEGSIDSIITMLQTYSSDCRLEYDVGFGDYNGGLTISGWRDITDSDKEALKKIRALERKKNAAAKQKKVESKQAQIEAAKVLLKKEGIL